MFVLPALTWPVIRVINVHLYEHYSIKIKLWKCVNPDVSGLFFPLVLPLSEDNP